VIGHQRTFGTELHGSMEVWKHWRMAALGSLESRLEYAVREPDA